MKISKIDTIKISSIRVKEDNPLATCACDISLIFCSPEAPMENGLVCLETDQIRQAIATAFAGKYLNWGEVFPLAICDGKLVLKVKISRIEALKSSIS
jgi:hypothetical protein